MAADRQQGRAGGGAVVIGGDLPLTELVNRAVAAAGHSPVGLSGPPEALAETGELELAVYLPAARSRGGEMPDAEDAERETVRGGSLKARTRPATSKPSVEAS